MSAFRASCGCCGCWTASDPDGDPICCNARCPESWQSARNMFETSLFGAACRQVLRPAHPTTKETT